jgi:amidohydrolase
VRGAKAMINDGLFTRFGKPDAAFALHAMPRAADEIYYRSGAMTSNGSALEIRFIGRGGHGSNPSDTIDPVLMAARFIVDVQSVVSREKDPAAFGVVGIGAIQGGSAGNIIPDSVLLKGTVRSQSEEVQQQLSAGIRRTANSVAAMAGAPPPQVMLGGGVKSVMNDPTLTARVAAVFKSALGEHARELPAAWSGGEDYTEFVDAGVPSLYFGLGIYDAARVAQARDSGVPLPANHSPRFAPADPQLPIRTGVSAMALAVLAALTPP